jgi:NADPH-dependent 2,4-dienoyl-CoA reductase/sulfur reductase-like enzyme
MLGGDRPPAGKREGQRVTRLVVIGGGAAGMSAASAARRVAPGLDVVVCEASGFAAYGMCGIPYYLGGGEQIPADLVVVAAGFDARAADLVSRSRAKYYPGSVPLHVRLVYDPAGGRLLGGQLAGREGAAKRVDVLATALYASLTIGDLAALDLSYAPPYAPVYDPVLAAAASAMQPAGPPAPGR